MPTLLRYDLTTDPFPLQASPPPPAEGAPTRPPIVARLTVVASNTSATPDRNPVTLNGISVTIPVGPNAAHLAASEADIGPVAPAGWELTDTKKGEGVVEYVFDPKEGQAQVGRQGLAFIFNNIKINSQPGTCQISVAEGSASSVNRAQFYLTKFPNGWGQVSFWLDPADVPFGSSTTLRWSGPADATYTIRYALNDRIYEVPPPGGTALGPQGQYPAQTDPPLKLDRTTVFTLSVAAVISGVSYSAQEQKTASVQVPPPQIISFEAKPSLLNESGDTTVTVSWEVRNSSQLYIDSAVFEDRPKGSWVWTGHDAKSFLAVAHGIPGYSGPPAHANAYVGRPFSSPFLPVWDRPSRPLWTFELGSDRPLFTLNVIAQSTYTTARDRSHSVDRKTARVVMSLAEGVTVADLGTARGSVASDKLSKATYGTNIPRAQIWDGNSVSFVPTHFGREEFYGLAENVGATWAMKAKNGALSLIWYEGAKPQNPNMGGGWSFKFAVLDLSRLRALRPETKPEVAEGSGTEGGGGEGSGG